MVAKIINLRTARKRQKRAVREAVAAQNRAQFGRPKAERLKSEQEKALAARKLDGAKRSDEPTPE